LILHRQTTPDWLGECLLDASRAIGQRNKITFIRVRKIS